MWSVTLCICLRPSSLLNYGSVFVPGVRKLGAFGEPPLGPGVAAGSRAVRGQVVVLRCSSASSEASWVPGVAWQEETLRWKPVSWWTCLIMSLGMMEAELWSLLFLSHLLVQSGQNCSAESAFARRK